MRNYIDIVESFKLDEYTIVTDIDFKMIDCSKGITIGQINPQKLQKKITVKEITTSGQILYGAVDEENNETMAILGFMKSSNPSVLFSKNAYTLTQYQNKGLQTELFIFVNKFLKKSIISDYEMSPEGVALWKKLMIDKNFSCKIAYLPTNQIYDFSEVGKVINAGANIQVIDPKDDIATGMYDPVNNPEGQKFFYLLESRNIFFINECVRTYSSERHVPGILQPFGYFGEGYP